MPTAAPSASGSGLLIGGRTVPLVFYRNLRARKYILRVRSDGSARITIPRGGTEFYAKEFVVKHRAWVESQLQKQEKMHPIHWTIGTSVLFRGVSLPIEDYAPKAAGSEPDRVWKIKKTGARTDEVRKIRFSNHILHLPASVKNLKPYVQSLLKRIALKEITDRAYELARDFSIPISKVVIRNQRSRWGSCSSKRNISLNWRLIQIPPHVRDYMIFHELSHVRHMDHSPDFWREVERMCPKYRAAEEWLTENQRKLFHA